MKCLSALLLMKGW